MTTWSRKHLEDISHAHIVSLIYKLLTSAEGSDDLSVGFDHDRNREQWQLTTDRNIKGKYHVRIMLKSIFGSVEHQEKATFGLGYKLTSTGNTDKSILNKTDATNIGKNNINAIEWYVSHYTPSNAQQSMFSKQILSKVPTEIQYMERFVFWKR